MATDYQVSDLMVSANIRKLVLRTVETYPLEWKVVHETLQNAKDAIRKAQRSGNIEIVLDVAQQSVLVRDDGRGFPPQVELFGMGGTDKDSDPAWCLNGRQGVGLKAVVFSADKFSIESVYESQRWSATIDKPSSYLTGADPVLRVEDPTASQDPSGTTVRYSYEQPLVSDFVRTVFDQYFSFVNDALAKGDLAKLKIAIECYFRSQSYAGDVNALLGLGGLQPITY